MSTALDNQKKLAHQFIETEATWDGDSIIALRSDDCVSYYLPKSLAHPIRNNEEAKGFYAEMKPLWTDYKVCQNCTHSSTPSQLTISRDKCTAGNS